METLYAYLNWQSWVTLPVNELPSVGTLAVTVLAFVVGAGVLEGLKVARLDGGRLAGS